MRQPGSDLEDVSSNMCKVRAKFALDDETHKQLLNEPDPLIAMAVILKSEETLKRRRWSDCVALCDDFYSPIRSLKQLRLRK